MDFESLTEKSTGQAILFITRWDEEIGPEIICKVPETVLNDTLMEIAINSFMTFQNVFGISTEQDFQRTKLTIPIKEYRCFARMLLDIIPNPLVRGDKQPFIIILLLPDTLSEDLIPKFDLNFEKIARDFKLSLKSIDLTKYLKDIQVQLSMLIDQQEIEINLRPGYSITSALEDFKKGITFFQQQDWTTAYPLLKKAHLKFVAEQQIELSMECIYLLATILLQLRKFQGAQNYYQQLSQLAIDLNHTQYQETATFMMGFCAFKTENFLDAIELLNKIDVDSLQFIKKVQIFSILGRSHAHLDSHSDAIEILSLALKELGSMNLTDTQKAQKAQLYYDIGIEFHQTVIDNIRKTGFSRYQDLLESSQLFNQAIENFELAGYLWNELKDHKKTINAFQIMGNIYGYLKDFDKQVIYYTQALEKAKEINDIQKIIRIVDESIIILEKQDKIDFIISLLEETLTILNQNAFVDTITIGRFYFHLGRCYLIKKDLENAILSLIGALNIYQRLHQIIPEHLATLRLIKQIYLEQNIPEKVSFYEHLLQNVSQQIQSLPKVDKIDTRVIKDVWFFTTTGIELFSYCPGFAIDPSLFSGFISALQSISFEMSQQTIQSFIIGEDRYIFYFEPGKEFYILGRSNVRIAENLVTEVLRHYYRDFYIDYQPFLENFSGNTTPFETFKEKIQKIDINLL